jgi:hypothetical protein
MRQSKKQIFIIEECNLIDESIRIIMATTSNTNKEEE